MEISTFNNEEFGEIRTIQENGEVLFCGADIAKALGYSNTRDALSRHCKGVVKCDTPTNGGIQSLGFISEGNVYALSLIASCLAQNALRNGCLMRSCHLFARTAHT